MPSFSLPLARPASESRAIPGPSHSSYKVLFMPNLVWHICTDSHQWLPIDHWIKSTLFSLVSRPSTKSPDHTSYFLYLFSPPVQEWLLLISFWFSCLRSFVSASFCLNIWAHGICLHLLNYPLPGSLAGGLLFHQMQDLFPITRAVFSENSFRVAWKLTPFHSLILYESHIVTHFFTSLDYRL